MISRQLPKTILDHICETKSKVGLRMMFQIVGTTDSKCRTVLRNRCFGAQIGGMKISFRLVFEARLKNLKLQFDTKLREFCSKCVVSDFPGARRNSTHYSYHMLESRSCRSFRV